jgi:hypothetical protein
MPSCGEFGERCLGIFSAFTCEWAPLKLRAIKLRLSAPLTSLLINYKTDITMITSKAYRTALMANTVPTPSSTARLSQLSRHFSSTSPVRKEIQDAYVLSAARTPTGKVLPSLISLISLYLHNTQV